MKIVVNADGDVGKHLSKMLSKENHDVVVMDTDEEYLNFVDSHFDVMTVKGSASSLSDLREAGIKDADLFIAITKYEEKNLVASVLAKRLGAKKNITRINNLEYVRKANAPFLKDMGMDVLIYPEILTADEVVSHVYSSESLEITKFADGKITLFGTKLHDGIPIIGKSLYETTSLLHSIADIDYRTVAIVRKGKTLIPRGNDVYQAGDYVYVVSNEDGSKKARNFINKEKITIKNVMILGASEIGIRVAKMLQHKFKIKLIERDKEKATSLVDELSDVLIINGDGKDVDMLQDERIKDIDVFIAVTDDSETNILSCILAKKMGVKKVIAEVETVEYIDIAESMGVDAVVNKKLTAASNIFKYTINAKVNCVRCLTGSDAEVMEFIVREGAKVTKGALKDIKFPEEVNIGGIIREGELIIATGNTVMKKDDKVVLFALPSTVNKLEKFF